MEQPPRPGNGDTRPYPPYPPTSTHRTAPNVRVNLPCNQTPQQRQYIPQQLGQLQQLHNHQQPQQRRAMTVAEGLRPDSTNFTSKGVRYRLPAVNVPHIRNAPGLHYTHPGFNKPELVDRHIASDMMEAMFLGDPGFFLSLNDGVKYFLWRRTLLKMQGKHVLTDRLFPHFPIFKFDFKTTFTGRDPRTGMGYTITRDIMRGTYAYFYSCWRRKAFPSGQDDRQKPGQPDSDSNSPSAGMSFDRFLLDSKFWSTFGPLVAEDSEQGTRLRNAVVHNLVCHLDIAYQRSMKGQFQNRDDAMGYIEASAGFWSVESWQHPEDYVPTPGYHRNIVQIQQLPQLYPYAMCIDEHVDERESRLMRWYASPDERLTWMVRKEQTVAQANAGAGGEFRIRPVTEEEADFIAQFINFNGVHNVHHKANNSNFVMMGSSMEDLDVIVD